MSFAAPPHEQLVELDEWVKEILPAVLGVPGKYAIHVTKLDAVSAALAQPALRIGERSLYADLPAKAAATMTRLLRARPLHYGNYEVAVATAVRYLALNGARLVLTKRGAADLAELAKAVAKNRRSETELASFLARLIDECDPISSPKGEQVLVYVSIPAAEDHRQHLYHMIEESAVAGADALPFPLELATTSPALIAREPMEDWGARRGALVQGERDVLSPLRPRPASGMIAVAGDGAGIELGLELSMIGPRGPVLLLHAKEMELPKAVLGYAIQQGNIYPAPFQNDEELRAHVRQFICEKGRTMVTLARQRSGAGISCTPLQHRLRRRLADLDPAGFERLLAATNFRADYVIELVTEPLAYARAEMCDICLLANELGEPLEDHVTRPAPPKLTNCQQEAWLLAAQRLSLSPPRTLELRQSGEDALVRFHGRVSLSEPEDWEKLLVTEVSELG